MDPAVVIPDLVWNPAHNSFLPQRHRAKVRQIEKESCNDDITQAGVLTPEQMQ